MDIIILLAVFLVIALMFLPSGKTFKCKKCNFVTDDPLRAAGHVAIENAHKCEEV
jgi:hypothetical protein